MKKSVLVIGAGIFGAHIVRRMAELEQQVMIVDRDEERVQDLMDIATGAMIGDATRKPFLEQLEPGSYDFCVVTIGDDFQASLEVVSLLKETGAKYVIARASSDVHKKFLLNNGADEVVYPEAQLAEWTAVKYSSDLIFDYIELDENSAIYEVSVPEKWVGRTLRELDIRKNFGLNIIGVRYNGRVLMGIHPDMVLEEAEKLLIAGSKKNVLKYFG